LSDTLGDATLAKSEGTFSLRVSGDIGFILFLFLNYTSKIKQNFIPAIFFFN